MARVTYRITVRRIGADDLDAGTVTLEGDAYGQHTEADAMTAALPELRELGGLVMFRGHAVPVGAFLGLSASLDSMEA